MANSIKELLLKAKQMQKSAFIAAPTKEAAAGAAPIDPNAMPPMDPNAMPPMDPAMMAGGAPVLPPPSSPMIDPNMPENGGIPMDPNMAPPIPMDPNASTPEESKDVEVESILSQLAEGLDNLEQRQNSLEKQSQDIMAQFSELNGKIELLLGILNKQG